MDALSDRACSCSRACRTWHQSRAECSRGRGQRGLQLLILSHTSANSRVGATDAVVAGDLTAGLACGVPPATDTSVDSTVDGRFFGMSPRTGNTLRSRPGQAAILRLQLRRISLCSNVLRRDAILNRSDSSPRRLRRWSGLILRSGSPHSAGSRVGASDVRRTDAGNKRDLRGFVWLGLAGAVS